MQWLDIHTHNREVDESILRWLNYRPNIDPYPNQQPFTVGYHPYDLTDIHWHDFERAIQDPNCQAVGECGLDKLTDTPWDLQLQLLEQQLDWAKRYRKPVLFHCVKAHTELLQVCQQQLPLDYPKIMHGFSKKKELAEQLVRAGFTLSFGERLLHSPTLQQAFQSIPLSRILLETDGHAFHLIDLYQKAAALKNMTVEDLLAQLHQTKHQLTTQI